MNENVESGHVIDDGLEESQTLKEGLNKPKLQRLKSMSDKIRDARDESKSTMGFISAVFAAIGGTLTGIVLILIIVACIVGDLVRIIVGSIHMHECPIRKGIPIVLVFGGALGMIGSVMRYYERTKDNQIKSNLLSFASFVCFIALCILVYGSDTPQHDDPNLGTYCNESLYHFSLWFLNITLGIITIVIGVAVLICIYVICHNKE